ncbi:MAG: diguanylate cyclase [Candidatus Pelagadaptatus aseana]
MVTVGDGENGTQKTGLQQVLHDPQANLSVAAADRERKAGRFFTLQSAGSTRLQPGAYWSFFQLHNAQSHAITIHLEYVDHQLIHLDAYAREHPTRPEGGSDPAFEPLVQLSMERPFSHRPVEHHRFVVPVELQPAQTLDLMIRFGSNETGYTYPSMRIWSPEQLQLSYLRETMLMSFLFGSFFLISVFALIAGLVTGQKIAFLYSAYALSKIFCWATILGYTHQFILRDNFHWSLMSTGGAITILLGLIFARSFLQTGRHTPHLDRVIQLMIINAALLLLAAIFQIKPLALITITLALLLYPVVVVAALRRWQQGVPEAGVFSLAWGILVMGLIFQALRDLGVVEHTLTNYYWPPVGSFIEMLTIMFAMGLQIRRLRQRKEAAEHRYLQHLENSRDLLEQEVKARTRELEQAKFKAEQEARTDPLTGILNRRSFVHDATLRLKLADRKQQTSSLLLFDLDYFKSINDRFGHSVGDEVLCRFAETVSLVVRETDVFGRLGGEEFVLLVSETAESAKALAKRLQEDISTIHLSSLDQPLELTASIGLVRCDGSTDINDLMHRADQAMYEAKAQGRNLVVEVN